VQGLIRPTPYTYKRANQRNVRCDASRHFRNKKREYLKDKINELTTNSKNKNAREI
jgi:hypothetical protein